MIKTILDAIKKREHADVRVTYSDKWLLWDTDCGFIVYQRKFRAKHSTKLYIGFNEEEAINVLLDETA